MPNPLRMGCEMPDVTKAPVAWLAGRTRALKRPAATAHLGPLWPLGKIVGAAAQERRMGSRHQGNGAGEELGRIAGRHQAAKAGGVSVSLRSRPVAAAGESFRIRTTKVRLGAPQH